jgi:hypothetical protein
MCCLTRASKLNRVVRRVPHLARGKKGFLSLLPACMHKVWRPDSQRQLGDILLAWALFLIPYTGRLDLSTSGPQLSCRRALAIFQRQTQQGQSPVDEAGH